MTAASTPTPGAAVPHTAEKTGPFVARHIGPQPDERDKMLAALGLANLDDLVNQSIPEKIRMPGALELPPSLTEAETLDSLRALASQAALRRRATPRRLRRLHGDSLPEGDDRRAGPLPE